MGKKIFPTEVVLGCVSFSRKGNPIVHSEVMLPLVSFLTGTSEKVVRERQSTYINNAAAAGIGLVQMHPKLDKIEYLMGYGSEAEVQAWLNQQYAVLGRQMEIEPLPKNFTLTSAQRKQLDEATRHWCRA